MRAHSWISFMVLSVFAIVPADAQSTMSRQDLGGLTSISVRFEPMRDQDLAGIDTATIRRHVESRLADAGFSVASDSSRPGADLIVVVSVVRPAFPDGHYTAAVVSRLVPSDVSRPDARRTLWQSEPAVDPNVTAVRFLSPRMQALALTNVDKLLEAIGIDRGAVRAPGVPPTE